MSPARLSSRHPLGATLLLAAVCLTIAALKWPAVASYVWQRHHVYLAVPEGTPDVRLPGALAARTADIHTRLTALANTQLGSPAPDQEPPPPPPPPAAPPADVPVEPPASAAAPAIAVATPAAIAVATPRAIAVAPAPVDGPIAPVAPIASLAAVAFVAPIAAAPPVVAVANLVPPAAAGDPGAPAIIDGERLVLRPEDKVLFCGDSLMQGLAPTIAPRLRRSKVAFTDLSKQSTGLAYPSAFDWPKTIRKQISSGSVSVLVLMVGANDAWDIIYKGKVITFGSPEWYEIYGNRVESIVEMAEEAHVRVVWVGLPPMNAKRLTTGAPVLNAVFRDVVGRHDNALFIPAAGAFSDDGATFTRYKANSDGMVQLLRASDGIHLAPAGNRLLSELVWSHVEVL